MISRTTLRKEERRKIVQQEIEKKKKKKKRISVSAREFFRNVPGRGVDY